MFVCNLLFVLALISKIIFVRIVSHQRTNPTSMYEITKSSIVLISREKPMHPDGPSIPLTKSSRQAQNLFSTNRKTSNCAKTSTSCNHSEWYNPCYADNTPPTKVQASHHKQATTSNLITIGMTLNGVQTK